ncbi:ArsC family reductase [Vogesella sp. LIG4]|uniref:ArsC family reductase n=1 Tax=Vogesella sp. LIG4 TaxID=1192162 RepID=UPI00081FDD9B|nr:ArsC family reductase [Vogesella sp. LIG4]SCK21408.1 arsenate reductase [Vogesella sp. LIG4]
MITLYGIPNCDTVKKARQWLTAQDLDYTFHDFKKQGVDAALLQRWIAGIGLDKLINRAGTTWRALSDAEKAQADSNEGAIALLQAKPSIIKRPVLDNAGKLSVGFKADTWQEAFGK